MRKIAVITDSHGVKVRLEMFSRIAEEEKFDLIIHCGDGVSDAKQLAKTTGIEVKMVAGNCDIFDRIARELIFTEEGVRMMALHGDMYDVKWGLTTLSYHAEEKCVSAVLYGHTHQAFAGYVGNVLLINPGALKDGRYAELHIRNGQVVPFLKEF